MSKEIIINVSGDQSRIAIVEDGSLVELYVENPDNVRTLGDIYLAQVRRILPGIKAAFVDIGQKQDAFLHFSDLSDNVPELLELAEGRIKERSARDLPTTPPSEGVEAETAEEQLATRRHRDVKRSRSGRKKDAQPAEETPAAEAASSQEASSQEASAEAPAPRRGARRRGPASPAPAILPPDARGAVQEPSEEAEAEAPEARTDETAEAGEEQRSSRRRRRGRRRKSGAQAEETAQETSADAAGAEAPPAEPAPDEEAQEPSPRRRGSRRRGQGGEEASPEETSQAQAAEAPAQEDEPAEAPKPRSRRRGKAEPAPETQPVPEGEPASEAAAEEAEEPSSRRRGRGRRRDAEGAAAEEPTHLESPRVDSPRPEARKAEAPKAEKAEEDSKPEPAASGPARLVPSSRFVIDLTAKGGRSGPPRREEEEEEEERTSARRSRRASRTDDDGDDDGYEKEPVRGGSSNGSARRGKPPEAHLRQDQRIIVKIIKEPISAKGSRVSTDISLAGRFLVLVPAADYVAVSKKIESSKERRRLRALARSLLPEGFGLIVRTVADGRDAKALDTDLKLLLKKWYKAEEILKQRPKPPVQLYEDVNMVSSIVRDLFSEDYDRITVDDPKVYRTIKSYVQAVAPHMAELVHLHKGSEPVFRKHKVEKDVRAAFESRVSLPGGGYLFIETTEAMHVVDVNSGRAGRGKSQEENALAVNLEAAREIAKQLRLRDLGGIICVDFIDMRSDSYRKKVYDELKREFRRDRAVTKLLPMSDFGVLEITRQRLRPSITTTLDVDDLGPAPPEEEEVTPEATSSPEATPAARQEETAPGRSASDVVAHLERWLGTYRKEVSDEHRKRSILVRVHPFLAAYLQRGIPNQLTRWKFKTWLNFRLDVDDAADPLAFSVRDEKSGKNLTKKYDKA